MTVSTPESTALDLVRFHESAGGWSNVATVLAEMAYRIDPEGLRAAAAARKTPEIQRLGYLLDRGGQQRLGDALLRVLASRRYRPVPLSTGVPAPSGAAVAPWRVIPNAEVLLES
jgi:hypothetical protein